MSDVGNLIGLPVLSLISTLLPMKRAKKFCDLFGALNKAMLTSNETELVERIRATTGDRKLALDADKIPDAVAREDLYALFWVLHAYRTKSWDSVIEFKGREHLDAALERGNGAVLWRAHFAHACLPYYKVMAETGYEFSQFSHVRHGFSNTRFGIRFLNPIRRSAEDLYIHERVVRTDAPPTAQLRTLLDRLEENGIVSIASRGTGANYAFAPFMNGHHGVAPGAPHLAHTRNATLLPVFSVRTGDDAYTVTIEPPIEIAAAQSCQAAIKRAAKEYGVRLESWVLKYPEQWLGWMHL